MSTSSKWFKRSPYRVALFCVVLFPFLGCGQVDETEANRESSPRYTIGIVTWIGYGPLYVAKEHGYFADEGVSIDIQVMNSPGERAAAYRAGRLQLFPNTPDALAILLSRGADGRIVMPLDESRGADGLVARKGIDGVVDLRGKTVAFQSGITSHFLLLHLLDNADIDPSSVVQENLGAGEAGAAFVAGKVDAAVTWEPWLSRSRESEHGKVLVSSADLPGLLADVLLVPDSLVRARQSDLIGFARAWYRGVDFTETYPDSSAVIIGNAFNLEPAAVREMFDLVHFFSPAEAMGYLSSSTGNNLKSVFNRATNLYMESGVIESGVEPSEYLESAVLEAVVRQ